MSKHTPGPWFVVNVGDDDEPMYSVKAERIRGRGPTHEVALCATGDSTQEMETANARLISAAPDMLEALRNLRDAIESDAGMTDDVCDMIAAQVKSAIAKAEGRK